MDTDNVNPRGPLLFCVFVVVAVIVAIWLTAFAHARDDGRYANSPLRGWFDSLRNKNGGFCCSVADGQETEYDIREGKYWVPLNGTWIEVPDDAVITEPNKFGRSMVWLMLVEGKQAVRCFMPGSGM